MAGGRCSDPGCREERRLCSTVWLSEQQAARDWCSICPMVLRNSGSCRPATYCRS